MQIATVPRTLVHRSLRSLRFPLELAESVARVAGLEVDERWPPSLAYEGFEAEAKRLMGSLLRDEELVDEGMRQRAKAEELRQSLRLQSVADATRIGAERRLERSEEAAEEQRRAIAEAERAAEQEVEAKRRQGRAKVRQETERRREAVEKADEDRQEIVAEAERAARRRQLKEQSAALAKEQQAVDLEAQAQALADTEEKVRQLRKNSS